MLRSLAITSFLLLAIAPGAAAQGTGGGSVSAAVNVGGKSYDATGAGSCRHTPNASIYNVPAALWLVEYSGAADDGVQRLHLRLWRPKNGSADQLSLNLRTRSSSHRIDVGGRGDQVGNGKVSLFPLGAGGRFEVKGKDEKGTRLEVVIKCPTFAGVEAEGG